MYKRLGDATLKNGETVEIGCLTAPDAEYAERARKLLGHKGWEWLWQVDQILDGKTDEMESRFYVARRGDALISNVCTLEKDGVGTLCHVWTPEAERRKGLASAIFERLMPDFRERGGHILVLGTEFDTPPYHIYKKFGFVGFSEGSGHMSCVTEANFLRKYYRAAPVRVVPATWSAYPRMDVLASQPEEFIKSISYNLAGKSFFEQAYVLLKHRMGKDTRIDAQLIESERTGAIVGYAFTVPDSRFEDVFILDLYAHPSFTDDYGRLLSAMKWPDAKVQCCVEAGSRKKSAALTAAGFTHEATFKAQMKKPDGPVDLWVFSRLS